MARSVGLQRVTVRHHSCSARGKAEDEGKDSQNYAEKEEKLKVEGSPIYDPSLVTVIKRRARSCKSGPVVCCDDGDAQWLPVRRLLVRRFGSASDPNRILVVRGRGEASCFLIPVAVDGALRNLFRRFSNSAHQLEEEDFKRLLLATGILLQRDEDHEQARDTSLVRSLFRHRNNQRGNAIDYNGFMRLLHRTSRLKFRRNNFSDEDSLNALVVWLLDHAAEESEVAESVEKERSLLSVTPVALNAEIVPLENMIDQAVGSGVIETTTSTVDNPYENLDIERVRQMSYDLYRLLADDLRNDVPHMSFDAFFRLCKFCGLAHIVSVDVIRDCFDQVARPSGVIDFVTFREALEVLGQRVLATVGLPEGTEGETIPLPHGSAEEYVARHFLLPTHQSLSAEHQDDLVSRQAAVPEQVEDEGLVFEVAENEVREGTGVESLALAGNYESVASSPPLELEKKAASQPAEECSCYTSPRSIIYKETHFKVDELGQVKVGPTGQAINGLRKDHVTNGLLIGPDNLPITDCFIDAKGVVWQKTKVDLSSSSSWSSDQPQRGLPRHLSTSCAQPVSSYLSLPENWAAYEDETEQEEEGTTRRRKVWKSSPFEEEAGRKFVTQNEHVMSNLATIEGTILPPINLENCDSNRTPSFESLAKY